MFSGLQQTNTIFQGHRGSDVLTQTEDSCGYIPLHMKTSGHRARRGLRCVSAAFPGENVWEGKTGEKKRERGTPTPPVTWCVNLFLQQRCIVRPGPGNLNKSEDSTAAARPQIGWWKALLQSWFRFRKYDFIKTSLQWVWHRCNLSQLLNDTFEYFVIFGFH